MVNDAVFSRKVSRDVFITGFFGNLILAILKLAAGLLGSSALVVMDGLFSAANTIIFLLLWQGNMLEKKENDEKHPYGYGKGLFLILCIASLIVLVPGIYMFFYSVLAPTGWGGVLLPFFVVVLVTLLSIIGNELLYRYLRAGGQVYLNSMLTLNAANNRFNVIGSSIVFLCLVFFSFTGSIWIERTGVGLIAIIMFVMSLKMVLIAFNGIMDKSVPKPVLANIEQYVRKDAQVKDVLKIKARHVGTCLYVDVWVAPQADILMRDADKIARRLEKILIDNIPLMREANVIFA